MKNLLFICSKNQWRSPTAERVFGNHPGIAVRSAGTSERARRTVRRSDITWAHVIYVMEEKHKKQLCQRFRAHTAGMNIRVLDIPDDYTFMDPELISLLKSSLSGEL